MKEVLDTEEAEAALGRLQKWGGLRLVQEMTAIFAAEAPRRLTELSEALEKRDTENAMRAAHSIRSTAAQLGAVEIARSAEEAEQRAEAGDVERAGVIINDIRNHLDRYLGWLRERRIDAPAR